MRRRVGLLAALSAVALLGVAAQAQAATFTVGSTADTGGCASPPNGNCTLRQLINFENARPAEANPADTIIVPAGTYQLTGALLIDQSMTIAGAGARTTFIENSPPAGVPRDRVFDVTPAETFTPTVTISGLAIESGLVANGGEGGNVLNQANLTLSEDLIASGSITGGAGAGIANLGGTLTVTHSMVSNNQSIAANGSGGAAGGIDNLAQRARTAHLTIDDSTIANNTAQAGVGGVGGIWSRCATCLSSTATITNSTIASNEGGSSSTDAGGLLASATSPISVQNSIVAFNSVTSPLSGKQVPSNCSAAGIGSLGHNLQTGSDCTFAGSGDLQNTDPHFLSSGTDSNGHATSADNGGNTNTFALAATSPAVDAVPANVAGCSGTDQRDVTRPQGSACDTGAYELFQPIEGQGFTRVVGSILPESTMVSITWGDGTSSTPSIDAATNEVTGTHAYAEAGVYHGAINFINSDHLAGSTPFDVKVTDAPLSAGAGAPRTAIVGKAFSGTVATFTDANPLATVSDFSATINWGDGTAPSPGTVSATPLGFAVNGTHTYATVGSYPTTISIADVGGSSAVANGTATAGSTPASVRTSKPVVNGSTKAGFRGSVTPADLPTIAHFEYGLDRRYITPGASGPQYDHSTPSQPVGSDFTSHDVSASVSGLVPNALYHVRLVATNAAGTTNGPDMTFMTARGPTPGPPRLGKTFNVSATGLVLIKVRGVFIPLTELTKITNGTIINALHGTLSLTTAATGGGTHHATLSASTKHKKKPKTQTGKFGGAVFKVTQAHSGLATLALVEGAFKGAPSFASCTTKTGKAVVAALSKKTLQLLHGSAHGKFRTRGRYAAATVRGTIWTIADRCDGTLTHAIKDTVTVNDFVRHKTIILRPGHSYLAVAKPPHKRK